MVSRRNYVVLGVLEKAYEVEQEIMEDLEQQGYDDNALFGIRLAMDEALINAIRHGNKNDQAKTLKIDFEADRERVCLSIEDDGDGFDHNALVDPTEAQNLGRTHGRGIFLIKQFMHDVNFNEKGNKITFTFNNEASRTGEFLGLRWMQRTDVLILTVDDVTGFPQVDEWEERIRKFICDGHHRMVVDLNRLEYINTTILSFLVMVAQSTKAAGGGCGICAPNNQVLKVIKSTNLDQLMAIFSDVDDAISYLKDIVEKKE